MRSRTEGLRLRVSPLISDFPVNSEHVEQFYAGSLFLANNSLVIHSKNEMNEDCDGAEEVGEDLL